MILAAGLGFAASSAVALTFSEIDLDGDGTLNATEFAAAYPEAAATYFSLYDRDGNGAATADEVRTASELLKEGVTIQDMDLDEDGELERDEVEHVFSAGAQAALSKFDEDGDGKVTLDEVRASDDPVGARGRGAQNRSQGEERATAARERGRSDKTVDEEDAGEDRIKRNKPGKSEDRGSKGREQAERARGKPD